MSEGTVLRDSWLGLTVKRRQHCARIEFWRGTAAAAAGNGMHMSRCLADDQFRFHGHFPRHRARRLQMLDHTWIWRADHGSGVGWDLNSSRNGLVVNGSHVTAYGLFVEHHQQFQVLWNGNWGRTYMYQSEIPYDPPDQASYSSAPGVDGWASYKVADGVTHHQAWGLGVYSVFLHPGVVLTSAIEVPHHPGVRLHHMVTIALGHLGAIEHVIDDAGAPTSISPRVIGQVSDFP